MNNACPSCGAVYNVAAKDIGRKIKCKKCNSPLSVTDAGLVYEAPSAAAAPGVVPPAAVVDDFAIDDDPPAKGKFSKGGRTSSARSYADHGPGALDAIGGLPTVLFAVGTFLVIVFAFMPIIGAAAVERADAAVDKLTQERDAKIKKLLPKGKQQGELTSEELKKYQDDVKKITDDYEKQITEAADDAKATKTSNKRSVWLERYGLMFGFLFLSFGSLGYLRTEQPLVMRIVAAIVLTFALVLIFSISMAGGCGVGRGAVP